MDSAIEQTQAQAMVGNACPFLFAPRPKLLTEGATILSIAPMLWATGAGAEVIRPMAAPVLGGLLIADEVIHVFLPVLYFAVQKGGWSGSQSRKQERRILIPSHDQRWRWFDRNIAVALASGSGTPAEEGLSRV